MVSNWRVVPSYGLSNGPYILPNNIKTQHRVLNKYFGGRFKNLNLKQLDSIFATLNFHAMDDIDALKITLYYFADRVLNERKDHS